MPGKKGDKGDSVGQPVRGKGKIWDFLVVKALNNNVVRFCNPIDQKAEHIQGIMAKVQI